LAQFLGSHGLVVPFCEDDMQWKLFVKILARVILDVPLTLTDKPTVKKSNQTPKKKTATKYVKSITVERSRNQDGVATLTWAANCHTPLPDGVDDWVPQTAVWGHWGRPIM